MQFAIKVENLSKSYRIGKRFVPYRTLRETIMEAAAAPWRRFIATFRPTERRRLLRNSESVCR